MAADPHSRPPLRGVLRHDEPMAAHTSWRVGGPAERWYEPADRDDLLNFVRALPPAEPVLWLGLGSNLLVRDGGLRGTVIALHGALDALHLVRDAAPSIAGGAASARIVAQAGVHCARLAKFAEREHLAGLGFLAGIPGTVGGALAMNAGAWGGETWAAVEAAEVVYRDGRTAWLAPHAFEVAYRSVRSPAEVLGFLGARFVLTPDGDGQHAQATKAALAQRKATQPVGRPSAGSTFRNPPGDYAARLIEACGLKGLRIGGAEVSRQHANFIITGDGACAADVETLIARIREEVQAQTGIGLETEVRIVGLAPEAQA